MRLTLESHRRDPEEDVLLVDPRHISTVRKMMGSTYLTMLNGETWKVRQSLAVIEEMLRAVDAPRA